MTDRGSTVPIGGAGAEPGRVPALSIRNVGHRFGSRQALDDVSLDLPAGRFAALLGPNGAGKTTLFSVVTRLYDCRVGSVRIFGFDLRRESSRALAELGVVFQARTLVGALTPPHNPAYHAALHGLGGRAVRARVEALLDRIGLAERIDDKVATLSGGQARRVEIVRALLHAPRLLLLDEATVGLDLDARSSILETVRGLVRDEALSVLWATHIFEEVEAEDDVYILNEGRIVGEGPASVLAARSGTGLATAFRRLTERGRAA